MQIVLQSIGVSIWQMAVSPNINQSFLVKSSAQHLQNGHMKSNDSEDDDVSEVEDETDSEDVHRKLLSSDRRVAIACDNGAVQLYTISDSDGFMYYKSLPRVSGEKSMPLNVPPPPPQTWFRFHAYYFFLTCRAGSKFSMGPRCKENIFRD